MLCKYCNNPIAEGEKFCSKCLHDVDTNQVVQPVPTIEPVMNSQPTQNTVVNNAQPPKNKNGMVTALIVIGVLLVVLFVIGKLVLNFSEKNIDTLFDKINENIDKDDDNTIDENNDKDDDNTIDENNDDEKDEPKDSTSFISNIYGEWVYEESGGSYIFNKDGTYKFYLTDDHTDGYASGTYDLRFGALSRSGEETYYKYYDTDGNKYFDLTTYPIESKIDGVVKTYEGKEGALEFVLTLMEDNNNEMNMYNESSQGTFTVIKK